MQSNEYASRLLNRWGLCGNILIACENQANEDDDEEDQDEDEYHEIEDGEKDKEATFRDLELAEFSKWANKITAKVP